MWRRKGLNIGNRGFSNGAAVDAIETEKSRIILDELEPGWWILASIGLTRISSSAETSFNKTSSSNGESTTEYSAREVSPPALLLQQVLRAHRIFLLHHSPTLAGLYTRLTRVKFCRFLKRFWDGFIWNWDVLLNGNPAVDVFNGLKLGAGGELGIGVGEEEWGSGEREVMEGFIERTDGLVDLMVSRFGDAPQEEPVPRHDSASISGTSDKHKNSQSGWHGAGQHPRPSDGVIFSGIGAITRSSVRDISSWMETLYQYGEDAYGVRDNPSADYRRQRKRKSHSSTVPGLKSQTSANQQSSELNANHVAREPSNSSIGIPPSIITSLNASSATANASSFPRESAGQGKEKEHSSRTQAETETSSSGTETLMKYLTLGVYGSKWASFPRTSIIHQRISNIRDEDGGTSGYGPKNSTFPHEQRTSHGYFLIGLQGELEQDHSVKDDEQDTGTSTDPESISGDRSWSSRTMLRTLHVERAVRKVAGSSGSLATSGNEPVMEGYYDRLRVVVYVQQPFIFTFLFELHTDSLAIPSFYHSLHHQLGPLQRPLLASTSPRRVSERLLEAAAPKSISSVENSQPICDLVYDPANLTVHTTIPNIPEPTGAAAKGVDSTAALWSRVEALSVHSQILNTYSSTRCDLLDVERTSKISRGWWVVWMRLPHDPVTEQSGSHSYREAFLIRKASDYASAAMSKSSGRFGRDRNEGSGASGGWNPGRLAEGIGIDARQYIEGILSLNR
ncbi:hypothetical protein MMC07_006057 [Pseudocyphellaria aurata]|nr:hypothetical protein [Pseudocyphellaria aurata]